MFAKAFDDDEALQLWNDMREVPFGKLTWTNVLTFAVMYLSWRMQAPNESRTLAQMLGECKGWADKSFMTTVLQELAQGLSLLEKEGRGP